MAEGKGRSLDGKRVLIVEDEYFVADDIMRVLVAQGAEVIGPVPTLDEALRLVGEDGLDLAVVDLNLRGEMAISLADALLERQLPFVFSTGYDKAVLPERLKAVPRWEKPYDYDELAAALPALMKQK